ncbi:MAG: bifunctional diaminohydroxyphosphoribosylaminopyrimidine deaminase/5-amino-6-(5-phosphoribosylamino)uracil reductase RibD [Candidatus Marinimicrobia bacterium]|nr:bifunctional diaminohydroxyphosphoribosylaminopyrimidine deaminase/5-amino-6-(5-phosphoribosylamino)uracil reductase RibD [Candidatus Neomarinimicrobiota bacterium]
MIENWMREALRLAADGTRRVSPNPRTGALILRDGKIIGRGRHECCGQAHAEVNAIRNAGGDLSGCEMVVTLEPCCHTGKTPPCTDAIIRAGIKKVYVGMTDPNPLVSGKGIATLRDAGVRVVENILSEACAALNQPFIKMMTVGVPYVIAKMGMTLDGYIADSRKQSKWITSDLSRKKAHEMRAAADAVLVGIGTVLADDPQLTVRDAEGEDPVRLVFDPAGILSANTRLVKSAGDIPLTVIAGPAASAEWRTRMEKMNVRVITTFDNAADGLKDGLKQLGEQGIQSILAEGGGRLHSMLAERDLIDRLELFIAPELLGGGVRMMQVPQRTVSEARRFVSSAWEPSGPDMHFSGIIHRY